MIKPVKKYIQSDFLQRGLEYGLLSHGSECKDVGVLFVQDGWDYLINGKIHEVLRTRGNGKLGILLVLVPPGTSEERYHYYHPNGKQNQEYLDFFTQELVPDVLEDIKLQGKKVRKMGLLGDSLGATVSLTIATQEPSLWTDLLLQSGVYPEILYDNMKALHKRAQDFHWNVYQVVGLQEDNFYYALSDEVFHILTHNRKLMELFSSLSMNLTYYEENEGHLWTFWQRDLSRALDFFIHK
ncbi:alpha/beta hydrolase-fold protein [Sutcliffiella horikoshii]|uniref:alpha/beta hydrolase-fold protein n=1 Tax=Sutcliffiella horikoshii TaxID=79883 RepID=UPI0016537996|nr:alpha/beta hydrolase-fold protein [Sutcliffiella horikoshii]